MLALISATPSPYARKNRIALLEKGIPFQLQTEIPWHSATETPKYNPLEKLPILIFDNGDPPIYESWFIQEYITQKYRSQGPSLLPETLDEQLLAKQIQVIADGACDAMVGSLVPFLVRLGLSIRAVVALAYCCWGKNSLTAKHFLGSSLLRNWPRRAQE